jgi:hypothetical protein
MTRRTWCALAASLLIATTSEWTGAQERPSFAGRWTVDAPTPPAPGGRGRGAVRGDMGSGWGNAITLTQDASRLTVEFAFFTRGDMQPPTRVAYALDGSESTNTRMLGRGIQAERSHARWEAATLVITTTYTFPNPATDTPETGTITRRMSLESTDVLVVDVVRHGVLGGQDTRTQTKYRRVAG